MDGRPGEACVSANGLASLGLLYIEGFSAASIASSDGKNGRVPTESVRTLRRPVLSPMSPPREWTELSPFHRPGPCRALLLAIAA